jgi:hypothetical protein
VRLLAFAGRSRPPAHLSIAPGTVRLDQALDDALSR